MPSLNSFKDCFQRKWAMPQQFMNRLRYDGKVMRGDFLGMLPGKGEAESTSQIPAESRESR